jgi:DNA invertase Pin-like site-specific DNA recombinase
MKAFLLARVSTDDQKDALPAQSYRLIEYAKRMSYEHELFEIKESAYKETRNDFGAVVDKIKVSTSKVIVVFDKIDRYTRDSSSEQVRILQSLYRADKIELHFPSDNLYIHQGSPATDLLRLGMGIVVAQYYSDAISDNVKRKIEQKLRDGEWIGKAPTGYKNTVTPQGKKWVEIDAFRADVVRQTFQEYASGNTSLRLLSKKWLDDFGIKAGSSKIEQVLKNPFYYGEMRIKGKLYPHKYDAVISRDLFDQVDAIRNGYKITQHRWGGLPYPFRGLIKCAECGCRITFEKKKGLYIYGHCTQSKGKHNAKYVTEDLIGSKIAQLFQDIRIPEEAYEELSTALRMSHEDKKRMRETTLRTIDTEIEKYQTRIEKVYEDYLDEKIPEQLYQRKFEEYKKTQKSLQNKRLNIEQVEDDYYGTVSHLLKLAKDAPALFSKANNEQKRSMINLVLSNLQLDGDQLRWEYKKPFDTMAFCHEMNSWLRRLDSNQRPRS